MELGVFYNVTVKCSQEKCSQQVTLADVMWPLFGVPLHGDSGMVCCWFISCPYIGMAKYMRQWYMEQIKQFSRNTLGVQDKYTHLILFLVGCIGVRTLFVYLAKTMDPQYLKWAAIPAITLVIAWLAIYFFHLRDTGGEVLGGKIWWDHMRPIHAGLYLAFAVLALRGDSHAWFPLALDVIIGLSAFIHHRVTMM